MIRIEANDRVVSAWLSELAKRIDDPAPAMRAIGHTLAENTRLRFRSATAPDGTPWAPLSPVTIAKRRNRSDRPLLDTGRLRNSITYALQGRREVIVGTNVVYGAMQHFGARKGAHGTTKRGAPIPWGNVPPRPYLGISRDDARDIVDVLRAFLAAAQA